jgi:hypothetical protein
MKQIIVLFFPAFFIAQLTQAQNVGIGTTTPLDKLSVQTTTANYGVTHTDGTITVGTYVGNGYGWLGTKSTHPLAFFTNGGAQQMVLTTNGNVGIGTTAPANHLQIGDAGTYSGNAIAYGSSGQATGLSQNASASIWGSTTHIALLPAGGTGYVGINTSTPANNLQIGDVGGYAGNAIAYGTSGQATGLSQNASASVWGSTTNMALLPTGGAGYVGINIATPTNQLQIGSVGSTGYAGNALAIGNGFSVMAFNQQALETDWQSSSNIYLKPLNANILGRVYNSGSEYISQSATIGNNLDVTGGNVYVENGSLGIGTTAPQTPLDVESIIDYGLDNTWQTYGNSAFSDNYVSMHATGMLVAEAFVAFSDRRIKDIIGTSSSTTDLATLNQIQITDYTMKDKMMHGNRAFKKVIAQQVETVYPQVVTTRTDFIPNVYQAVASIKKTDKGWILLFDSAHHISKSAAKLKAFVAGNHLMSKFDILSIPSDKEVEIKADKPPGNQLFVYGEEVNDFRTVDYEGLSTLNISATQELSKLIKQQEATIAALNAKVQTLIEDIKSLKQKN